MAVVKAAATIVATIVPNPLMAAWARPCSRVISCLVSSPAGIPYTNAPRRKPAGHSGPVASSEPACRLPFSDHTGMWRARVLGGREAVLRQFAAPGGDGAGHPREGAERSAGMSVFR